MHRKKNSKDNLLNFAFTEEMRVTGIGTVKSQAYRDQMKNQREERRPPKAPKPSIPCSLQRPFHFYVFQPKERHHVSGFRATQQEYADAWVIPSIAYGIGENSRDGVCLKGMKRVPFPSNSTTLQCTMETENREGTIIIWKWCKLRSENPGGRSINHRNQWNSSPESGSLRQKSASQKYWGRPSPLVKEKTPAFKWQFFKFYYQNLIHSKSEIEFGATVILSPHPTRTPLLHPWTRPSWTFFWAPEVQPSPPSRQPAGFTSVTSEIHY